MLLKLNEHGGNTFDIVGSVNGPQFLWMLMPESETIDLATRFSFLVLLPAGAVFIIRAVLLRGGRRVQACALVAAFLLLLAIYVFWIGVFGGVFVLTRGSVAWEPPNILFPEVLYLVIHKISVLCIVSGAVLAVVAWTYRARFEPGKS